MVYAIQATLGFRNTARRNGVLGNIQAKLQTVVTWGEVHAAAVPDGAVPDPSLTVEVRFGNEGDADAFYDQADVFFGTGVNGPVTGSTLRQHVCPHDESDPQPCVVSRERVW